jgi:RNA polymerase sigma-70 factor (ECF subfamily)
MDDRPDAELLLAARTDADSFGVFYRRHVTAILAFLVRRSDPETGADLTAETFAVALDRVDGFDPRRGEPIAWLYGIARNRASIYHRTGAIERRAQQRLGIGRIVLDDEQYERIERLASLDVSSELLTDALDDLPADQRDAVLAHVVDEHSYDELSRAMDISAAGARQRVSRGLATLRDRLGGER